MWHFQRHRYSSLTKVLKRNRQIGLIKQITIFLFENITDYKNKQFN
jgi:hypothetical protein